MHPVYHREKAGGGGGLYLTQLEDGTEVSWKPLSIGEFIEYDKLIKSSRYPFSYIENEIFVRCVQERDLVKNIDSLPAGLVSAVVAGILLYSGPQSIDELTLALNIGRNIAAEVLHMLATYICQAFPAYKLEDVYALDYTTFMLRVAQSENKMIRTGVVSEPLTFIDPNALPQESIPLEETPQANTQDLLNQYYEQERIKTPAAPRAVPGTKQGKTEQTIIRESDMKESSVALVGHEVTDKDLIEHQMVQETSAIYQDYLQQSKNGKITIKTPEQRKAEYLARAEKLKKLEEETLKKQKEIREKALEEVQAQKEKPKRIPGKRRR